MDLVIVGLALQASENATVDIAIVTVGLVVSVGIAAALLARQRAHARPEDQGPAPRPTAPRRSRQQRILAKLEPMPEIPTVMDLVREEVEATGVERIPGHEGLTGPVMLKVYRRDRLVRERCTHDGYAFSIAEGVDPAEAMEDDVTLFCSDCGPVAPEAETEPEE